MKRFDFRLQPVLNLRQAKEDGAKRVFAEARRAAARAAEALAALQAGERQAKDSAREAQRAREVDVAALLAHQRHLGGLARAMAAARGVLAQKEAAVAAARDVLVAAARERKALEKLRERRREEWTRDALRDEQKTLDEIGQSVRSRLS